MNRSYRKVEYWDDDEPLRNRTFERSLNRKRYSKYSSNKNPQNEITMTQNPSRRDNYKFIGEEIVSSKNRSFRENGRKHRIDKFEGDGSFRFNKSARNYREVHNGYENDQDLQEGYEIRGNEYNEFKNGEVREEFDNYNKSYVEGSNRNLKEENRKLRHRLREGYKKDAGWYGRKDNKKYIEIINENKIFIKENKKYLTRIKLYETQIKKLNLEKKNKFVNMKKELDLENKVKFDNLNKEHNLKMTNLQKTNTFNMTKLQKELNLKNSQKLEKLTNQANIQLKARNDYIKELELRLKKKDVEYSKILQSNSKVYVTEVNNNKNEEYFEMEVQNENKNRKLVQNENLEKEEKEKENLKQNDFDHIKCEEQYLTYQKNLSDLEIVLQKNENLLNQKNSEILKLKNRNQELSIENENLLIIISDLKHQQVNNPHIAQNDIFKQKLEDLKKLNKNLSIRIENFEKNHKNCTPQKIQTIETTKIIKTKPKIVTQKYDHNKNYNTNVVYRTSSYYKPDNKKFVRSSKRNFNNEIKEKNYVEKNKEILITKNYNNGQCVKCVDCGCYCDLGDGRGVEGRVVTVKTNHYTEPRRLHYGRNVDDIHY